jgi:hypothetical protein
MAHPVRVSKSSAPRRSRRALGLPSRMSSTLYLFLENAGTDVDSVARHVQGLQVPGYMFSEKPLKRVISAPGEPDVQVRCQFYAQNYFRVFVSDLAVEFYREATPPPDIANAEAILRSHILNLPGFKLRRWITTSEGWDDDDKKFVDILSQGNSRETLIAEPGAPPNAASRRPLRKSGATMGPPSVS